MIGGGNAAVAGYAALAALARDLGRAAEPVVRQRLAAAYTSERILDYMKQRVQAAVRDGNGPGIDGSVMKVLWSEARRDARGARCGAARRARRARRRLAAPVARAVLEHDRWGDERSAPNDDRRTGARAAGRAAGRSRRLVPRVGGSPCLTRPSRIASTTNPIRCGASTTACACSSRVADGRTRARPDRCRHRGGLALLRSRFRRGHGRGVDGRAGGADGPRRVARRRHPVPATELGCRRGAPGRRHHRSRSARPSSISCTRVALLQHLAQREAVLDAMIAAAKPGGWVVVSDVDWIQFDAQPVPEPFATLSRTLRELSASQHGYDGTWGRMLVAAFTRRGLADVNARGEVWTMRGGHGLGRVVRRRARPCARRRPRRRVPAGFRSPGRDRPGARTRPSRSCRPSRSPHGVASPSAEPER